MAIVSPRVRQVPVARRQHADVLRALLARAPRPSPPRRPRTSRRRSAARPVCERYHCLHLHRVADLGLDAGQLAAVVAGAGRSRGERRRREAPRGRRRRAAGDRETSCSGHFVSSLDSNGREAAFGLGHSGVRFPRRLEERARRRRAGPRRGRRSPGCFSRARSGVPLGRHPPTARQASDKARCAARGRRRARTRGRGRPRRPHARTPAPAWRATDARSAPARTAGPHGREVERPNADGIQPPDERVRRREREEDPSDREREERRTPPHGERERGEDAEPGEGEESRPFRPGPLQRLRGIDAEPPRERPEPEHGGDGLHVPAQRLERWADGEAEGEELAVPREEREDECRRGRAGEDRREAARARRATGRPRGPSVASHQTRRNGSTSAVSFASGARNARSAAPAARAARRMLVRARRARARRGRGASRGPSSGPTRTSRSRPRADGEPRGPRPRTRRCGGRRGPPSSGATEPPLREDEDEDRRRAWRATFTSRKPRGDGPCSPQPEGVRELQERAAEVREARSERGEGRDAADDLPLVVEDERRRERRRERRGGESDEVRTEIGPDRTGNLRDAGTPASDENGALLAAAPLTAGVLQGAGGPRQLPASTARRR